MQILASSLWVIFSPGNCLGYILNTACGPFRQLFLARNAYILWLWYYSLQQTYHCKLNLFSHICSLPRWFGKLWIWVMLYQLSFETMLFEQFWNAENWIVGDMVRGCQFLTIPWFSNDILFHDFYFARNISLHHRPSRSEAYLGNEVNVKPWHFIVSVPVLKWYENYQHLEKIISRHYFIIWNCCLFPGVLCACLKLIWTWAKVSDLVLSMVKSSANRSWGQAPILLYHTPDIAAALCLFAIGSITVSRTSPAWHQGNQWLPHWVERFAALIDKMCFDIPLRLRKWTCQLRFLFGVRVRERDREEERERQRERDRERFGEKNGHSSWTTFHVTPVFNDWISCSCFILSK